MKESKTIYFSHDTNASNDPKIINLRVNYGWQAVGIYWAIIESLHKEKNGELLKDLVHSLILDFCYQDNEEADKIEKGLYATALLVENNGITTSKRVKENLLEINSKSEIGRENALKRWANIPKENTKAMLPQCEPNAIKEKKVKESKRNNINNSETSSPKKPLKENSIQDLYGKMGLPPKTRNVQLWQDEANNAVKYFTDGEEKRSSVFKCFKDNQQKARIAFSDCKELEKRSVLYFLKVYNEIKK